MTTPVHFPAADRALVYQALSAALADTIHLRQQMVDLGLVSVACRIMDAEGRLEEAYREAKLLLDGQGIPDEYAAEVDRILAERRDAHPDNDLGDETEKFDDLHDPQPPLRLAEHEEKVAAFTRMGAAIDEILSGWEAKVRARIAAEEAVAAVEEATLASRKAPEADDV